MVDAREVAMRSRAAVEAGDREGWLSLFADDAFVEDPIGPSPFDAEGKGHHGKEAIAKFYDEVISPNEKVSFEMQASYLCGNEVADIGVIRTTLAGGTHVAIVHGVYTYRANEDGKLASLRAFWEFEKTEIEEV
jgi:steroid delta-isomerase